MKYIQLILKPAFLFFFMLLLALPTALKAQDEAEEEPQEEEEVVELIRSRIGLTCLQVSPGQLEFQVTAKAKIDDSYENLAGLEIKILSMGDTSDVELGTVTTDANGKGILTVSAEKALINEDGTYLFTAEFDGDEQFKGGSADASFMKGSLELDAVEEDSAYFVRLTAMGADASGEMLPLSDLDVAVFVKTSFGGLKVGEGYTDEDGFAEVKFPMDLKGDSEGNIQIYATILDTDEHGSLKGTAVKPWGEPVSNASVELPRALWSPDPPLWMVITFTILMLAVWGHYGVIIYELFRLKNAS